ncbi:hypothetical protein GYM41_004690 [Escherichia coli]|uniref:Uncharacterized protein n=1 Tax=Escherichia coli TaxID=562 RepID=A0A4T8J451_ECOLX|nr:hypothetical protein [Escherichia coli]EGB60875.1 hypothetical protein ERJG_03160 [Escherichia coli M863]EGO6588792.1 hypothetical protein [Escherichia coli]EGO8044577.1 hypothetical protein [Escherichia coli]TJQ14159.1 hypothetical protein C9Z68_13820 [Escherichia coli]
MFVSYITYSIHFIQSHKIECLLISFSYSFQTEVMFVIDCEMLSLIDYCGTPLYLLYQIKNHTIHITKPDLQFVSQNMSIFFYEEDAM